MTLRAVLSVRINGVTVTVSGTMTPRVIVVFGVAGVKAIM